MISQCTAHVVLVESVTEDRLNTMKLDYIAHRSERSQEAVEALRLKGEENFRRLGGKKVDLRI